MKLSIILPCYNEEQFLRELVKNIHQKFRQTEIIIVNDGSTDSTLTIARELAKQYPLVKVLSWKNNKGKGKAIQEGLAIAKGEIIGFIDGDDAFFINEIKKMISMLPVYDAVIGIKKEKNHPKRFRKFLASQWNKLVSKKVFLHYKDTQTGAKFFKKEFLKDAHFQTKGFAFDVELLLHLQKKQARIIEFPLSIKKQTPSTITLQSIREMRQELHSIAKSQQKFLALTFDVEETDFLKDKWSASSQGTKKLLQLLANKPSTFFVTQTFAEHHKKLLQKISKTHEVASHGISHKQKHIHIQAKELEKTRLYLEKIIQKPVYGFRAPRFEKPSYQIITRAGFLYDSSLHPTIVPGRYNNFFKKRNPHVVQKLKELPPSVTPFFRIPLSYVSFRLLPLWLLHLMTKQTLKYSPGIILYFHPFEFVKLPSKAPWFQRKKTGPYLLRKLENYLKKYPQLEIITLEKLRRRL